MTGERAETSGGAVLQTVGLRKSFGGVQALGGVDFAVRSGEIHALVGENGAGKSTLIKVLTGVYAPDGGELRYQGRPVSFARPIDAQEAGISTIYQEVNLIPLLSVARNILLGREPRSRVGLVDVKALNRRAREVLDGLGIDLDVNAPLGQLGLGAQQMVALARATSADARVVIMDEPTSSLEAKEVATLFEVARNLRDSGLGIVFVSHRLDELWQLCDAVTVLRDGLTVHAGAMQDLSRVELISHMLGRDLQAVARGGATDFGESHRRDQQPVLEVEGLEVRRQLHDVSFTVRPGEVVGLGGLLGSGRSETVKATYGALPTRAGSVRVGGSRVRPNSVHDALRAGIALLSEDRKAEGIIPELSVRENIALAVLARHSRLGLVDDRALDKLVETFMRRLQIKAASPQQKVGELSGGNQQKVLIARWLCTEPKVFLLDEPTRGIDVGAKAEVQGLIDELAEQGLAVVLISSEMEELVDGSDEVVVLRDGSVETHLDGADLTTSRLLAALAGDVAGLGASGTAPGVSGATAIGASGPAANDGVKGKAR